MSTLTIRIAAACLFSALLTLPGCIVWDIRDEVKASNAQLTEVRRDLAKLDDTNLRLDQTIDHLERTNDLLGSVEKQLAALNTINTSLSRLDQHMAALRRTLGKLDSVIPFIDLGTTPVTDAPVPPPTADSAAATSASAPVEPAPAAARESSIGIWISRWPDSNIAMVMRDDNTYIFTTPAQEDTGTWKRDGARITLQNSQREKLPNSQRKPEVNAPRDRILEILSFAGRSMAVKLDGKTIIFARP